jgi:NADPH2:quinone reductase
VAPHGVDIVVEVAPAANAQLDGKVLAPGGVIAMYSWDADPTIPFRQVFAGSARWQGVLVYTVPEEAKDHAVSSLREAVEYGAIRVGADAGVPLHHFPLAETGAAHDAVEGNAVGKVLINID